MPDQERWVGIEDIAVHLGVNKASIYRWIEKRKMPAYRLGRLYRFRVSEVDAWVKSDYKIAPPAQNPAGNTISKEKLPAAAMQDAGETPLSRKTKIVTILKQHPFFEDIPEEHLIKLANYFNLRHFQKGEFITREGEPNSSFYIILAGKIKAVKTLPSGKEITLEIMHKNDIAGGPTLNHEIPRAASLEAMTQVDILEIKRAGSVFIEDETNIVGKLLEKYVLRFSNMADRLIEYKMLSIDKRLYKTLYELYIEGGTTIGLTHHEIADIIGTTSESVSRFFKPLKKSGILEINRGKIEIKDIEKLKSLVDKFTGFNL